MLRGRLRESEQLHRHHGLPLPLEIRHDEFTIDIPRTGSCGPPASGCSPFRAWTPNRSACCGALLRDFSDVTPLSRGDPVP